MNYKTLILAVFGLAIALGLMMILGKGSDNKGTSGTVVLSNSGNVSINETATGDVSTGTGKAENIYFIHNNDPVVFNEAVLSGFISVGKQYNQNLIPVLENDPRVKNIVDKATASGAMYYPMFVMSQDTTNINFSQVPADQEFVDNESKTFALLEPIMGNLPKIVIKRNEVIDTLLATYIEDVRNVKSGERTLIMIEDPMCPFCSQSFLEEDEKKTYGDMGIQSVYFPLPITGHENANKLIGILRANKQNQDEVLRTIFKNQSELGTVKEDEVFAKLKTMLKASGSKIVLKDGTGYTDKEKFEVQTLLIKLGVTGTPTTLLVDKDNLILIGNSDMVKAILQK